MSKLAYIEKIDTYNADTIFNALPDCLFEVINPGNTVILKPNWVKESHLLKPDDWDYVITHPDVVTAVLKKTVLKLNRSGRVVITDGPSTDASFAKIIAHYPVAEWYKIAEEHSVELEIIDLRDDEWINEDGITVERKKLPGDPKGSTEVNLLDKSEFISHNKSKRGYYGADYDIKETNKAHDGYNNLYRVSRTVIEADVYINLPKLKTHKKGGITCCLKNLVGINTYKNYLPHHSEGAPSEGGDQFPKENINARLEGPLMAFLKQHVLKSTLMAKLLKPLKKVGTKAFGDTNETVRSGNWYGNDTIWRMILDLNKVLFFANVDGSLREDKLINAKKYIGIVDGIRAGEGNGPMAPDPVMLGCLICGDNPAVIDAVCAGLAGFDPVKIPTIKNAFLIKKFAFMDFSINEILAEYKGKLYGIQNLPAELIVKFKPHFGWLNHIEKE